MKYFFMLFVCLTLSHFGYTQNDDRGYIVKVGDKAPDITITYTDGTRKKLSDFRGKIVMLQFTASWCGVCRKEMPFIEKDIWLKHKHSSSFCPDRYRSERKPGTDNTVWRRIEKSLIH